MSQISAKECCTSDIIIFCQLFCFMSMIRLLAITVVALGICASGVDGARRRGSKMFNDISHKTPDQHHETVAAMSRSGQHMSVIEYLENLMKHVDNLNFDDRLPSLYSYLGVAYHDASRSHEAIKAFQNCSLYHTRVIDPRCWMNEAEASMHIFRLTHAISALEKAVAVGFVPAYAKLLRAKGWTNDWRNFEKIAHNISSIINKCISNSSPSALASCEIESGVEYLDPTHMMLRFSAMMTPFVQSKEPTDPDMRAQLWTSPAMRNPNTRPRLKVGLLSSDFGVHPVATLIRGFTQYVDTSKIELFCFALTDKRSWWGINISNTVEHFINLASTNTQDAAMEIALEKIDILIDLNGGTLNSGLSLMGHKPAPVQISYIGFPVSTGASYIDYYLADNVALPAEDRTQFVEKLALIPTTSIVNDYAQIRGGLLDFNYDNRMPRDGLNSDISLNDATFLFATLSNFQKICHNTFHTWMNILNRMPGSKMVMLSYEGSAEAIVNLRSYSQYFGKKSNALAYAKQQPWIYHLKSKTALDMILDTRLKNGHTTGLDGLWAGVPTVTLGGMTEMGKRCGESFAVGLDMYNGLAFSLKEYEDIAIEYARNPEKLKTWRNSLGRRRVTESLFDTKYHTRNLEQVLESIWEVKHISARNGMTYNVVNLPQRGKRKIIDTHQVDDDRPDISYYRSRSIPRSVPRPQQAEAASTTSTTTATATATSTSSISNDHGVETSTKVYPPLPPGLLDISPLMLNLGGYNRHKGWVNVNVQPSSYGHGFVVEVLRSIQDLHGIPDGSVDALYCSHALEHVKLSEIESTLDEWNRVLKPGGKLFLSVPDLKVMARLLLDDTLDVHERLFTMRMIYGAQVDQHDFHHVGFDDNTLPSLLSIHNYCNMRRVGNFNIISDTSSMVYHHREISLNIVAHKCGERSPGAPLVPDHSSAYVRPNE